MTRKIAWPLLLTLTATSTFLLSTSPARAATGCSFAAPTATVTIDPAASATLKRAGSAIQLNGVDCGAATVSNTGKIVVIGATSEETLTIDLSGGPFAPGAGAEATGAPEIELEVNLAAQSAFGQDRLVVQGTGGADTYRLGSTGVNLNNDDDADVTGTSGGALATIGAEVFSVLGGAGIDTISGQGAVAGSTSPVPYPISLDLQGGEGNDTLTGGSYDDRIAGGPGADLEAGADHIDTFVEDAAANGNDIISGGPGFGDKLDYGARTAAVQVSLDGVANDGQPGIELDNVQSDVEFFTLGAGNDTFTAGSGAQLRVSAGAGTDTITGGTGSEELYGGANDDTIHGGDGNDLIYGGMGDDHLFGEDGYDHFYEDRDDGVVAVTGANGADDMWGGLREDEVVYANRGTGSYAITLDNVANDGLDSVPGGAAEEGDNVHDDVEDVTGSVAGPNRITGSSAANTIIGGNAKDLLSSLGNDDRLSGGYGEDKLDGGSENDILSGYYGNDTLLGQAGNDTLFGQGDNDTLSGGPGTDTVVGEVGDDTVIEDGATANGADSLSAGAGIDTLSYKSRTVAVLVDLDAATADDGQDTNGDGVADEGDTVTPDFENLEGGAGNDKLTGQLGSAVPNWLTGNGGDDVLTGNEGDDLLNGGAGADTLKGNAGIDSNTYAGRSIRVRVDIGGALDGTDANNDGVAEEGDVTANDVENLIGGAGADLLIGSAAPNVLTGNGGKDDLQGLDGPDKLDGGAADDKLTGGTGIDIERGGPDNDAFDQGAAADGADELLGEAGVDTADYSARSASVAVNIDDVANDGEDTNHDGVGLEETDNVHTDVEDVHGGSLADILIGSNAANTLVGNGGPDFLDGGLGADTFDGGNGVDTVSYQYRLEGVIVTAFDDLANDGNVGEHDNVLHSVENLLGGEGNDGLSGNPSANLLEGNGGDDALDGREGADVMQGGLGTDLANYESRTASVRVTLDDAANDGTDATLDGVSEESDNVESDVENVFGGSAPDALTGDADSNELRGGSGDDELLDGRGGDDKLFGGEGNDLTLMGGDGRDTISGGAGDDYIHEGSAPNGADEISGGPGLRDGVTYFARSNPVKILMDDAGNDGDVATSEGDNVHTDVEDAVGGAAGDALQGSSAANHLYGGPGNDGMHGNDGLDALYGGGANDTLFGDAGDDTLGGGPGDDNEQGGAGADVMQEESAANGADTFTDSDEDATVDYSLRSANLVVDVDGVADDGVPGEKDNVTQSIERVRGGKGMDRLTAGRPNGNLLFGGPGMDFLQAVNGDNLYGDAGWDTLNGGPQHDKLIGGPGSDSEFGNGGDDWFWETGECNYPCPPNGPDEFHGGAGLDRVEYTDRVDPITVTIDDMADDGAAGENDNVFTDVEDLRGGHGDDTLTGSAFANRIDGCFGSDTVNGGAGDDTLGGDAECIGNPGSDTIHGDTGDDVIYGDSELQNSGDQPDQLFGDDGADIITGGGGADHMEGGANSDIFYAKDGFVDTLDGGTGTDAAADFDPGDVQSNIP
jgi:Ca2+-binding RTX toxin-like protein